LGNLELREEVIIMTVSELILKLIKMQPEWEVEFYCIENNNLIKQEATVLKKEYICEIILGKEEE
jgi:hypothetical protein|tara:strand:- start:387 stop:581 length:195 start_codon:yes stop_codon:yes gene_type:complete